MSEIKTLTRVNIEIKIKNKNDPTENEGWTQVIQHWLCAGGLSDAERQGICQNEGWGACEFRDSCRICAKPVDGVKAGDCAQVNARRKNYDVADEDVKESIDAAVGELDVVLIHRIRSATELVQ